MKEGIVLWITGLAGAGKSTIAKEVYNKLKAQKDNVVYLDGDVLRETFGNDLGYTLEDRKKSAMRYSRLCKLLSRQNIDVVCSTISMFDDCRRWNRENIKNYKEVYIKVPMRILKKRKEIYNKALNGEIKNVIGVDLKAEKPKNPDLVIINNNEASVDNIVEQIYERMIKIENKMGL